MASQYIPVTILAFVADVFSGEQQCPSFFALAILALVLSLASLFASQRVAR
jgi:hypothetical protein